MQRLVSSLLPQYFGEQSPCLVHMKQDIIAEDGEMVTLQFSFVLAELFLVTELSRTVTMWSYSQLKPFLALTVWYLEEFCDNCLWEFVSRFPGEWAKRIRYTLLLLLCKGKSRVKWSLCLTKHHAMKTYRGSGV
jgi:hypothetical protein